MAIPARRRLLLLGQAGDRDDTQLRALVQAAWGVIPFERVIIKEMVPMLRGREVGVLPAIFADELARLGVPAAQVETVASEFEAIRHAFAWASDGDVLVCPVHVDKARILAWLAVLRAQGWEPGMPLPA
jgi:UDP-N-acetylmuramyl tripeptide synthase